MIYHNKINLIINSMIKKYNRKYKNTKIKFKKISLNLK